MRVRERKRVREKKRKSVRERKRERVIIEKLKRLCQIFCSRKIDAVDAK